CVVRAAVARGAAPCDRNDLTRDPVAHGGCDLLRQRWLQVVRHAREPHDLRTCPLQRGVEPRTRHTLAPRLGDSLPRPLQSLFVHGRKATLATGGDQTSPTTTCPAPSSLSIRSSRGTRRGCWS